jgi:hypothetical protein
VREGEMERERKREAIPKKMQKGNPQDSLLIANISTG